MSSPALVLEGLTRVFVQGGNRIEVLRGASLTLRAGELVALVGPSGSGKSTLLHIAGLLEHPDAGDVVIGGQSCARMSDTQRTELRRRHLGFVYQFHHLLPEFSALENVMLPQMIAGVPRGLARSRAKALLASVALGDRESHRPARLSGGEQQRVAFTRALANAPAVLLADEPTGNLDPATAEVVFRQMLKVARDAGLAGLIATHNPDLARRMDRTLVLRDGLVASA